AMTHHVASMLQTYPKDLGMIDQQKLAECIEACFECAQTCTACSDACLAEDMVADLTQCIRLNQDCADVCETTGRVRGLPLVHGHADSSICWGSEIMNHGQEALLRRV